MSRVSIAQLADRLAASRVVSSAKPPEPPAPQQFASTADMTPYVAKAVRTAGAHNTLTLATQPPVQPPVQPQPAVPPPAPAIPAPAPTIPAPAATKPESAKPTTASTQKDRDAFFDRVNRLQRELYKRYPAIFDAGCPVPLMVGISREIAREVGDAFDADTISDFMRWWTGLIPYLTEVAKPDSQRHGLDGQPTQSCSDDHRQWATVRLAHKLERYAAKRAEWQKKRQVR